MGTVQATARKESALTAFLVFLLIVDVFLMATYKIGDYDTWYYLAAGRHIAQTGSLVHDEPFAYTVPGTPWHTQTWLSSVLFFSSYSAAGIDGLILFNALLVAGVFLLVFLNMRLFSDREADLPLALALTLVAAFSARFRFMVRPHILEFLCLAGMFYLLNRHRLRGGLGVYLVPLLQVLWVNSHGSHILGLVLPLLYATGSFLQGRFSTLPHERAAQNRLAGRFLLVFAACVAATFLNPSTYKAFIFPFTIVGQSAYMKGIGEWTPLRLVHFTGYSLSYLWGFLFLALLALIGFARRRRPPDIVGVLLFLFFLVEAIRGIRLTAEFGIAISVVAFKNLAGVLPESKRAAARYAPIVVILALLLAVPPLVFFGSTYAFGLGVKENKFPIEAVKFIKEHGISGTMFNSFAYGDYLCWAVAPERKVFIHGRNDIFPEELFNRHTLAETSPEEWEKAVGRYGFTYAIIQYYSGYSSGRGPSRHLTANPEWVPVYWDPAAVIYLRDIPANRAVIERFGYRFIRPAYLSFNYLYDYMKRGLSDQLIAELNRHLTESPRDEEGYIARSITLAEKGRAFSDKAIADMKAALAIYPNRARSRTILGALYQREGLLAEAEEEYRIALGIDPKEQTEIARFKTLVK